MSGKKRVRCPACGKHAGGNFCKHCGTALGGQFCGQCGAEIAGRFCNQCGAEAGGPRGGGTGGPGRGGGSASRAARPGGEGEIPTSWWFAGAVTFALLVIFGWTMVRSADPEVAAVPVNTAPVMPDPSQMTPRQTADQLFNRVLAAAEGGDTVTARQFLPMALQAYEAARPLDMDGLFHVALLQKTGAMFEAALATANEMLAVETNHIMALAVAAQVTAAMGREDEAAGYYQRVLDHHDAEIGRPLSEYETHSNFFSLARDEATAFLVGR